MYSALAIAFIGKALQSYAHLLFLPKMTTNCQNASAHPFFLHKYILTHIFILIYFFVFLFRLQTNYVLEYILMLYFGTIFEVL